ncbi:unnamed protein product [Heligmosomoides polygyrus]|uniref:Polyprotein n=1 Tax=Heligmosomoides polygyrus TaxID=6339 RepID=A0A183GNE4_HELPZ|nr:unnamed protein product [Heligmosomoides polygyrus]
MDRIRNDAIRQKFGVAPITDKMRGARLRWYGYVLRGKEDSLRKICLNFEAIGKRPRGRPKQRWADTIHMDLKSGEDAQLPQADTTSNILNMLGSVPAQPTQEVPTFESTAGGGGVSAPGYEELGPGVNLALPPPPRR